MTANLVCNEYRAKILRLLTLGALACAAAPANGQVCVDPVNETCDAAIEFFFDDLPYNFVGQLGCTNNIIDRPYFDVFFIYQCTVSGEYMVDLCGSVGDTYLKIYDDQCTRFGNVLAEDDDSCGGGSPPSADPMLSTTLVAGTTYWFEVGSWRPDPPFAPPPNAQYLFNVSLAPAPCPGDVNGDGLVNITDLGVVLMNFGSLGATLAEGDLTGDGTVDISDLGILLAAFGAAC